MKRFNDFTHRDSGFRRNRRGKYARPLVNRDGTVFTFNFTTVKGRTRTYDSGTYIYRSIDSARAHLREDFQHFVDCETHGSDEPYYIQFFSDTAICVHGSVRYEAEIMMRWLV